MNIVESTKRYEKWLKKQLPEAVVDNEAMKKDLDEKHDKMAADPFQFLRATYWRWAQIARETCPELVRGPQVAAVGDIHLENYGVWRDEDGRLIWGVNDFDEAAQMPYPLDLARLVVSAVLAPGPWVADIDKICRTVLAGYRIGLEERKPFVLDRDHLWLRRQFEVDDDERDEFWMKIEKKRRKTKDDPEDGKPPELYREILEARMLGGKKIMFWRSSAGIGSLGRPRWVAYAEWRGGPILREAKALVPSAWTLTSGSSSKIGCREVAGGQYRAPDPYFEIVDESTVVRRLSPNSRKLEVESYGVSLLDPRMLGFMGQEVANVHCGLDDRSDKLADKIRENLNERERGWLAAAVRNMAAAVSRDHEEWTDHYAARR